MKTDKLRNSNACKEAVIWVRKQKNYKTAWQNCNRGDWMLWLAKKLNVDDKKLTITKAMCAKQVEHLMKDQRSKDALQACFDYADGKITREELNIVAHAAHAAVVHAADAAVAHAADAAYAATHAAYAAAHAAADAADAADAAYVAAHAAADAADAAYAAAHAAADAAYDAAHAAADAAYAAAHAAADAADAAYAAAYAASLKKSADICREYLTEEVLSAYSKL